MRTFLIITSFVFACINLYFHEIGLAIWQFAYCIAQIELYALEDKTPTS